MAELQPMSRPCCHGALAQGPAPGPSGRGSALTATEALVAGLADAGLAPSLWLATSGAVSVTASDAVMHPEQALVWGLGKTLGLEQPRCLGGLVDLPEPLDARAAERLVGLLGRSEGEDEVALREGGVLARRLVRAPSSCGPPAQAWAPRGTVLVTGAAGSSGAEVVRWLGHAGAKHVLLAVDPGQGAEELEALDAALGEMSVDVSVAPCDLRARAGTSAARVRSGDHPLGAVIHIAGAGESAATTAIAARLAPARADPGLRALGLRSSCVARGDLRLPRQGNWPPPGPSSTRSPSSAARACPPPSWPGAYGPGPGTCKPRPSWRRSHAAHLALAGLRQSSRRAWPWSSPIWTGSASRRRFRRPPPSIARAWPGPVWPSMRARRHERPRRRRTRAEADRLADQEQRGGVLERCVPRSPPCSATMRPLAWNPSRIPGPGL